MSNIVEAFPREGSRFKTKELFQWDAGQYIHINLQNLPASYTVEFSNSTRSDAVPVITTTDLVEVPSQFLESGEPVYSWIVIIDELSRTTEYSLMTPVTLRSKPTNTEPRPEEKSVIDQAIAALNNAVEKTEQDSIVAQTAAEVATEKSIEAQQYAESAEEAKNTAIEAKEITVSAKDETVNAKQSAEAAASNADASAENSANSAAQAATSAQESLSFSNISRNAADTAVDAKNATSTIKTEVEEIKNISVGIKNEVIEAKDETVTAKNITETKANEAAQSAASANQSFIDTAEAKRNAQAAQIATEASAQSASQSALAAEQSKTAAQLAADSVAGAMDSLESTIAADLEAAKSSGIFDGEDGVSPEVTVTAIAGGNRITITDVDGTHTVDIPDGEKGDAGRGIASVQKTGTTGLIDTYTITYTDETTSTFMVTNGQAGNPGTNGVTFTPEVASNGVISWTNDGGRTNPQPVNIKGPQGDDGTSPTVSVVDISGGHRVTVTDANGTRSFDVMDGDDYVLTAADKAEIAQQAAEEVDVPVQDVKVNGVSVLTDGVANVPLGTGNTPGVVRPYASYGTRMIGANNDLLATSLATDREAKAGTNQYKPIVPSNQHVSVFYALAKVAGDTTQSASSNKVGVYTDEALVKIQKMLGIYEAPWELIREDTFTNATEADHIITVDGNGEAFELTDVVMMFETPKQDTDASKGNNGSIFFYRGTGSTQYYSVEPGSWTQAANATAHGFFTIIRQEKNMLFVGATAATTNTNSGVFRYRYNVGFNEYVSSGIFMASDQRIISKINIKSVLGTGHYKLYGKRKWD